VQGIEVTSEVPGTVSRIGFEPGQHVERGALLIELDSSTERAQLRSIEAQLAQARTEAARTQRLLTRGAISEQDVEQASTAAASLRAQGAQQRAVIDKKRIDAPFTGELGIRRVDMGEYVQPGQPIVSLQQLQPMYVNFRIPEQQHGKVAKGQSVTISVEAFPGASFSGEVTAIDPMVDMSTRSFNVQATVPNDERKLQPGMFAAVTLDLPDEREVVVVPATAISFNAFGESVFLVRDAAEYRRERQRDARRGAGRGSLGQGDESGSDGPDLGAQDANRPRATQADGDGESAPPQLVVQRVFVETGERRGLMIAIQSGVSAGDRVVTAGQMKLQEGRPVAISDSEALAGAVPVPTTP
jgi:membrane fusion protein (multidrug efflux system)